MLCVRFSSFHLKIGDKIIFLLSVCDHWLLSMNMVAWIKVLEPTIVVFLSHKWIYKVSLNLQNISIRLLFW